MVHVIHEIICGNHFITIHYLIWKNDFKFNVAWDSCIDWKSNALHWEKKKKAKTFYNVAVYLPPRVYSRGRYVGDYSPFILEKCLLVLIYCVYDVLRSTSVSARHPWDLQENALSTDWLHRFHTQTVHWKQFSETSIDHDISWLIMLFHDWLSFRSI